MKLKIGRSINLDEKTSEWLKEFDLGDFNLIRFIGVRLFINESLKLVILIQLRNYFNLAEIETTFFPI
jgi:hypothetical protein